MSQKPNMRTGINKKKDEAKRKKKMLACTEIAFRGRELFLLLLLLLLQDVRGCGVGGKKMMRQDGSREKKRLGYQTKRPFVFLSCWQGIEKINKGRV